MNLLVALLLLGAPRAAADLYPIAPVDVILRVEPDRVVADVDSDAIYWIEEVLNEDPLPPRNWSAMARTDAQDYVNAHLLLAADGKPLPGRLISATYRQPLGDINEEGRIHLRLVYPPLAGGARLSGDADFFKEYRQEVIQYKEPFKDIHGHPQIYETLLSIPGRAPKTFVLTPEADSFSISAADARRTRVQRALQSLRAGAFQLAVSWTAWPALLALALSLGPGVPSRSRAASGMLALAAGALLPLPPLPGLFWAAGAVAALGAGRWLSESAAPWLEVAALAALGRGWADACLVDLPRAVPGPAERGLAALATVAAAAAVLAALTFLVGSERRRLIGVSESRAGELFQRRRRLGATVLGIVSAWGFLVGRNW